MIVSLSKIVSAAALIALIVTTIGCSDLTAKVNGKVYYDGSPVKVEGNQRGKVVFRAVDGGATCMGLIDSSGNYSISTGTTNALVPGDYLVSVSVVDIILNEDKDVAPKAESITPKVYNDTLTSGLTFMAKRGNNVYDIRLKAVDDPVMEEEQVTDEMDVVESEDSSEELVDSTPSSETTATEEDGVPDAAQEDAQEASATDAVIEDEMISESAETGVKQ